MKIKKILIIALTLGALQVGTVFSSTDDIITRYQNKTRKKIDPKTGKVKTTQVTKTTKKSTPTPAKKHATTKKASSHHDVKTTTEKKTVKHDLNPHKKETKRVETKKTTTHHPAHLRDAKTGRFESENQLHPHDAKTGRFSSKSTTKTEISKSRSLAKDKKAATHRPAHLRDPKTGRFETEAQARGAKTGKIAGNYRTAAPYAGTTLGAAAAATLASTAHKSKLTNKEKEARAGALAQDRQVARDNTDWKRSKNIKHYGRKDRLKEDTKDQRKQYGWRWLKAPWSTGTGAKGSYAFWNGQCGGWMYFDEDKGQWWNPCQNGWTKNPEFETGTKPRK